MEGTVEKSMEELIACARRELRLRRRVYAKWVKAGSMDQADADHEIACMEQILSMLEVVGAQKRQLDMFVPDGPGN